MAIRTRLELATSAVTGRRSNQIELPDRERLRMIAFFNYQMTFLMSNFLVFYLKYILPKG